MKVLSTVVALLCVFQLAAQRDGIVSLNEQPEVTQLMDRYVSYNRQNPEVNGWRIQILATTDRAKMEQEFNRFKSIYPTIPVTWTNERPYYKISAGAFLDKLGAIRLINQLSRDYRDAYPTRARFSVTELL